MPACIEYQLSIASIHGHRFGVRLRIPRPQAQQVLSLPVWIPGSYLVREFARHLSPIQATQGGQAMAVTALDKAHWQVDCRAGQPLELHYEVYAFDTSVRAAFLDSQRGFFNGTSVFLKVDGQEDTPHRVRLTSGPKGWKVATALSPVKVNPQGWGIYEAPNYDELVDHPVELGDFWHGEFTARGVSHSFVVAGAPADFDGQKLLDDTRRICDAQIQFWHGRRKPGFERYVFMLNAVDDGYGGLEHRQSTALICSRKDLPRQGRTVNQDAYTTLLGLISHEYFHTWNVKRLKPVEFAPYQYDQENHTRMLWFFEGFTSYYDDQFLLRTGLINGATYLKLLGKTISQVLATPGRHHYSVAQASFDAWTRYYRPDENTANATVNYYTKGSLVALCLDLALRSAAPAEQPTPTLDGVMARLWRLQRPITTADVAQALSDEAGGHAVPPWALHALVASSHTARGAATRSALGWPELLDCWTNSTAELPLREGLAALGVHWKALTAPLAQRWGLRLTEQNGQLKVAAVMRDSLAERTGLSAGDELLALDDWRVRRSDDLGQWHDGQRAQTVLVSRDGRVVRLPLARAEGTEAALVSLEPSPGNDLAPTVAEARRAWLRH